MTLDEIKAQGTQASVLIPQLHENGAGDTTKKNELVIKLTDEQLEKLNNLSASVYERTVTVPINVTRSTPLPDYVIIPVDISTSIVGHFIKYSEVSGNLLTYAVYSALVYYFDNGDTINEVMVVEVTINPGDTSGSASIVARKVNLK